MQSVFFCSVVLLLLLLMLPVLLCSCTLFLHLLFHCNNSSTAHFLPSLTRSNPPHTRALSRERARRERERERVSRTRETPTTHCWTIIPAIQVSSRFSSILLVYVFILLYLFVGYCRPSFIQISSILQLYVSMYSDTFGKTLPPKFHQISSIFCFCLKFILILLQDIANQVSSNISSIFFLCNNLLRSLYWTMPSKFHPYFIHPWLLCL